MNGYTFFRLLQVGLGLGVIVLAGIGACIGTIYHEVALESAYSQKYGVGWEQNYEKDVGSLKSARIKSVVSAVGAVAIGLFCWWFYRILKPNQRTHSEPYRKPIARKHRFRSGSERNAYHRRNALLGIYFGLGGLFAGAALVFFRFGLFEDHVNEAWLGLVFFVSGYIAVIAGCSWWLKAKQLNPSLVLIGVMPFGILLIPYVRLILFAAPEILPVGMFLAALILIVVVFILPAGPGAVQRKPRRDREPKMNRRARPSDEPTDV